MVMKFDQKMRLKPFLIFRSIRVEKAYLHKHRGYVFLMPFGRNISAYYRNVPKRIQLKIIKLNHSIVFKTSKFKIVTN